jgi:uncharacterized protein
MADWAFTSLANPATLAVLILLAAMLYASVGHGGASGYLAVMALASVPMVVMRPTALLLNVAVSALALLKFYRQGAFSHQIFWPLAMASIPCAYLAGRWQVPAHLYRPLVGMVLIYAAAQSFLTAMRASSDATVRAPRPELLLVVGALLGLLSGMTGVGGGIFLSPLLLLLAWAPTKTVSGISAAFIFVNSIAGLLGLATHSVVLHGAWPWWMAAAVVGGWVGAEWGSKRLTNANIRRVLALVLLIAGVKMLAT